MSKEDKVLEELKRIRELLEPKSAPPASPPKVLWAEFKDFLSKYKVIGLAVVFILGLYPILYTLVQGLVNAVIAPIMTVVTPGMEWEATPLRAGHLVGALITFIIVAFVIFIMVRVTKRWR